MPADPRLVEPAVDHADSYRNLLAEFKDRGEPLIPFLLAFPCDDFPAFVAGLQAAERGEGLAEGFVPHSTYFLVAGSIVLGVSNLRHRLNSTLARAGGHIGYSIRPSERGKGYGNLILHLTLKKALDLGLKQVLLTCGKQNSASASVTMRGGGRLVEEAYAAERGEIVQRYVIEL